MHLQLDSQHYSTLQLPGIELPDSIPPSHITSIAAHDANVYVGSSNGQLIHFHHFEDSPDYMAISQQNVRKSAVRKIVVMSKCQKVVVLCAGVLKLYSLPELSPLQSGKLREVEDIAMFHDDLIVVTKEKLRLIRLQGDIKLLKSVPIAGVCALGHSNNKLTVATLEEYVLIDLQSEAHTPLFGYRAPEVPGDVAVGRPADQETETLAPDVDPEAGESQDSGIAGSNPRGDSHSQLILQPLMARFIPPDTRKPELLLVVQSDPNTSIGMFVTEDGEPTRGTLLWVGLGYPTDITIQWPYVFGIFHKTLVVASLQDCDIKWQGPVENLSLKCLNESVEVENPHYSIHGVSRETMKGTSIFISDNQVSMLYKEPDAVVFSQNLEQWLKGAALEVELTPSQDPLYNQLLILYLIKKEDFEALSTTQNGLIQLVVHLYQKSFPELRTTQYPETPLAGVYDKVLELCKLFDPPPSFKPFASNFIQEHYLKTLDPSLRPLAYSTIQDSQLFIRFANQDKEAWTPQDQKDQTYQNQNTQIIQDLTSKNLTYSVLHANVLLSNSQKVCQIAVELLLSSRKTSTKPPIDLLDIIFTHIDGITDPKTYRECLLELLQLHPKRSLAYIKKNVRGKFKDTHIEILKQIDVKQIDQKGFAPDFAQLKLEVLEHELIEGTASHKEVLEHLIEILESAGELEVNNFEILYQTYVLESGYGGPSWPQFLVNVKEATECREFLEVYLKVVELISMDKAKDVKDEKTEKTDPKRTETVHTGETEETGNIKEEHKTLEKKEADEPDETDEIKEAGELEVKGSKEEPEKQENNLISRLMGLSETFAYIHACLAPEPLQAFLSFKDYYSAEYYALYSRIPCVTSYYLLSQPGGPEAQSGSPESSAQGLTDSEASVSVKCRLSQIFNTYKTHHRGLIYFINQYGHIFTPQEIIDMVPPDLSLAYVQEYFTNLMVQLENRHRASMMKKVLARSEAHGLKDLPEPL